MTTERASILIVDDELQNCRLLEALLLPEGYLTDSVASGQEALAFVARQAPDLILLDVMMPGMDGYEVARQLKANAATSSIPIIMVTALIDRDARIAGLEAGAEEFLTKPVDRAELWLRVRNLLRLKSFNDFLKSHRWILEKQVKERTADLQFFRTALDATADAILFTNRHSMQFVEMNATACRMFGYSREEFLRMGPAELAISAPGQIELMWDAIIASGTSKLGEINLRRKDGSLVLVEVQRQALYSGKDWVLVSVVRDITERKDAEKRLHRLAHYDALTGLPNRTLFYKILEKTLVHARDAGWMVAVLFIDLDHFKNVNDTLGHGIGDELLRQFSSRLIQCVRVRDTVGRLGGDEFGVILLMQEGQQGAASVASTIRETLCTSFDLMGHQVSITASIGITVHPDDASDSETLLKYADTAMYRAKHAGRDTFRFFTAQMNVEVLARLELETALHRAIDKNEFVLYYQPKVEVSSGRVVGLEALLRWERPDHGLVLPNEFIHVLEETGLITRLGTWVIAEACRQIARWKAAPIGPVQVSVNVSGRQFLEGDLEKDVIKALSDSGIDPALLELELTETSLIANTDRTIRTLHNLKNLGVQISIDDFGTGYSSLSYLRRFPIDKLKIDIAFVRNITTDAGDAAIALTIIRMAHSLKLEVIAEGVETAEQLAYLQRHRCDQVQGYYFSPPVPVTTLETILREGTLTLKRKATPPAETLADPEVPNENALFRKESSSDVLACGPVVQIFETDAVLINKLEDFVLEGLNNAESAVVIATRAHLAELDERLIANGIDLKVARTQDRYIPLIAEDALARFMVNGYPDEELFAALVSNLVARAQAPGRKVRMFGELLSNTWPQGRRVATMRLEYLWNQLRHVQSFTLFCADARSGFDHEQPELSGHVCAMPSRILLA